MNEVTGIFSREQFAWIERQVADTSLPGMAGYLRELVDQDRAGSQDESPEHIAWVREKLRKGEESGVSDVDIDTLFKELDAKIFAKNA